MSSRLADKVLVVTGAGRGIGAATARRAAAEGARVAVVDLDAELAAATAAAIGEDALAVAADVSSEDGVDGYTTAALERFGRIDGVHLNAGVIGETKPLVESSLANWERVLAVNLTGVYLGIRAALRVMRDQAGGGSIVVTASTGGVTGAPLFATYSATKHGVIGLVRSAALEGGPSGVRVNAVAPSATDTDMARTLEDLTGGERQSARERIGARNALGRIGDPDEVAALVVWLLGDESSFCTGGVYMADAGQTAGPSWAHTDRS
jgi:NAD(P)-dependent dehydrogenase (short-subunit alcohol dehydrogenase family)